MRSQSGRQDSNLRPSAPERECIIQAIYSLELDFKDQFSKKYIQSAFNSEGFSLIELVVVVAVLAILSSIAIPAFDDMRKKAMITTAKANLILIIKECNLAQVMNGGSARFSDIQAWNSSNSFGDRSGINFGGDGFTYDTGLSTNTPIKSSDSCMSIAAKSNTISGSSLGSLPHFEIKYNESLGKIEKNCLVDSANTYNNSTCKSSNPIGSQW